MSWLQGIIGVALLAGAIFGWVAMRRKIHGDDTPLIGSLKRKMKNEATENELETFIAAYRDGKIDPTLLTSGEKSVDAASVADRPGPALSPAAATTAAAASPAPAAPPPAGSLLRPEVKLAYLSFRSGLRDHHIFANVRLGDLGYGVAVGTVDLLVCDPAFKYVAAVDVFTGEQPEDLPKSMFLQRAGVKYLRFAAKAMPKPAQLNDLIYGNAKM